MRGSSGGAEEVKEAPPGGEEDEEGRGSHSHGDGWMGGWIWIPDLLCISLRASGSRRSLQKHKVACAGGGAGCRGMCGMGCGLSAARPTCTPIQPSYSPPIIDSMSQQLKQIYEMNILVMTLKL